MRIVLDENLDWRLGRALPGHEVESVTRLGWAGIQNGLLLKKAQEADFDVLLAMDSNISFQQKLIGHPIKIVVLRARSNRLADTSLLMVKVGRALPFLENGTVTVIE
jgi:predicted nuclease of predicted toxin-antitoxin system